MKKNIIKKTIFSILTVIIVFGIYLYIGMVLTPKAFDDLGGQKYYSATGFKYEEKNTVDVMMYGNSDLYAGVSPMEIYKEAGITAFGCGIGKQTMHSVYKQVKQTFKKYQKPKLVVIEADCMYYKNTKNGGSSQYELMTLTAPIKYHARWKDLKGRDFIKAPVMKGSENFMKGYVFNKKIKQYNLKDGFMQNPDEKAKDLENSVLKDFDKIYKLCKKNNAELMILGIPTPITWSNAKHNGIQKLVDEYNQKNKKYQIKFLDFNLGLEGFDFATSFYDNGNHCNYYGMKVVTSKFCEYLQENFELTDRRGDDKYKTWDKSLAKYEKFIEKKV